ncbi:TlpA disulfide reductase family protein [Limibacter armeniacum]|uniref:TlpA disulfide reductase family protein n=1 Tax=Limibacter armeniacum TaxID=466084 RepID=UPI002FE6600C
MKNILSLFGCLLVISVAGCNADFSDWTVKGHVAIEGVDKVYLQSVENGSYRNIDSTRLDKGNFKISLNQQQQGFYSLKVGYKSVPIYLDKGIRLVLNFEPDTNQKKKIVVQVADSNSEENKVLQKWADYVQNLHVGLQKDKAIPLFFQGFETANKQLNQWLAHAPTQNAVFNQQFLDRAKNDLVYELISFTRSPQGYQADLTAVTAFVEEIKTDNTLFSNAALANGMPYLYRYISLYIDFMVRGGANQFVDSTLEQQIALIPNDTLKGYYLVNNILPYYKGHDKIQNTLRDYGKYLVTAKQQQLASEMEQKLKPFALGRPAINFSFPDINGKEVSLADLKGKLVYVDMWATWCAPCRYQIPHLEALEKEMEGKDIVFVSISVDKEKAKWEKFLQQKKLHGIQLHTAGFDNELAKGYNISSIPRFMLFDQEGKVVTVDAPRPSSTELKEMIERLL